MAPAQHDSPSSVLMFSGGIDSTAALKQLLNENDEKLYVHHIHIKNGEGENVRRYKMEAKAVRKIIPYMKKHYRNFNYSESTIDITQSLNFYFSYPEHELYKRPYVKDLIFYCFIGGILAKTTHSPIVYTACAPDHSVRSSASAYSNEGAVYNYLTGEVENKQDTLEVIFHGAAWPYKAQLKHLCFYEGYKKKNIEYLEDELMNMVWYCREPTLKDGHIIICNNCLACKDVSEVKRRGKYG